VLINRQKQQAKENQSQQALPLQSQITRQSNVDLFYQMGACNWDGVQSSECVGPPFLAPHFKSVESGSPSSHDSALSPVCCRSLDSTSTALHPERAHTDRAVGDPCPLVPPSLYSCGPPHLFPPRCFFPSHSPSPVQGFVRLQVNCPCLAGDMVPSCAGPPDQSHMGPCRQVEVCGTAPR